MAQPQNPELIFLPLKLASKYLDNSYISDKPIFGILIMQKFILNQPQYHPQIFLLLNNQLQNTFPTLYDMNVLMISPFWAILGLIMH